MRRPEALILAFAVTLFALVNPGCDKTRSIPVSVHQESLPAEEQQLTGETILTQTLDDIQAISDWAVSSLAGRGASAQLPDRTDRPASDTTYTYGQLSPEGYGSVVTEKYRHPKGLLLITWKRTQGEVGGGVVTETRKYITYESYSNDIPQDWSRVEVSGASSDTIVTHAERNGVIETYTFRLPVITRTVNPLDGSVRINTHYARGGIIFTEITDEHGVLIQSRQTSGWSDGSIYVRTEYPDHSWRTVRTLGQADGTILREITSGN